MPRDARAADDASQQMKLALEVFAAVGVLLIAVCVVYMRGNRGRPIVNRSPLGRRLPQCAGTGDRVDGRNSAPGAIWAEDCPHAKCHVPCSARRVERRRMPTGVTLRQCPTPSHRQDVRLRATFDGAGALPVTRLPRPRRPRLRRLRPPAAMGEAGAAAGETAAKKAAGPIYLDDLQELSAAVGIGIVGKHGETGYPEFESEYGPKVNFQGKRPKHSLSLYPPRKGAAYVSYVSKASTALCGRWRRSWKWNPADAARVAAEPFFMAGRRRR